MILSAQLGLFELTVDAHRCGSTRHGQKTKQNKTTQLQKKATVDCFFKCDIRFDNINYVCVLKISLRVFIWDVMFLNMTRRVRIWVEADATGSSRHGSLTCTCSSACCCLSCGDYVRQILRSNICSSALKPAAWCIQSAVCVLGVSRRMDFNRLCASAEVLPC